MPAGRPGASLPRALERQRNRDPADTPGLDSCRRRQQHRRLRSCRRGDNDRDKAPGGPRRIPIRTAPTEDQIRVRVMTARHHRNPGPVALRNDAAPRASGGGRRRNRTSPPVPECSGSPDIHIVSAHPSRALAARPSPGAPSPRSRNKTIGGNPRRVTPPSPCGSTNTIGRSGPPVNQNGGPHRDRRSRSLHPASVSCPAATGDSESGADSRRWSLRLAAVSIASGVKRRLTVVPEAAGQGVAGEC